MGRTIWLVPRVVGLTVLVILMSPLIAWWFLNDLDDLDMPR